MPETSAIESILLSTKKLLGLPEDYDPFDTDVIIAINSAFSTLQQLKVGPESGFEISNKDALWNEFTNGEKGLNPVKTYIYLRAKLLFDPPETSYAREALKKQADEIEWRLNVYAEGKLRTNPVVQEVLP